INVIADASLAKDICDGGATARQQVAHVLTLQLTDIALQRVDPVQAEDTCARRTEQRVVYGRTELADNELRLCKLRDLLGDRSLSGLMSVRPSSRAICSISA